MTEPTDRPGCSVCTRSALQLQGMPERWECSHVECPLRRPLTASSPERGVAPLSHDGSGCFRLLPTFVEH